MERPQSLIARNAIHKGDVNAVMDFLRGNPGAEKFSFWTGDTCLHHAARVGKSNIVKALLESTPAVEKDPWDNTALALATMYGNTEIAKYLVSKDSTLLSIEDVDQAIPVVTACRQGHKEMTNFLYSETPFEILLSENGKQGSELLRWCLTSKRFDIMLDVLHRGQSLIDKNWKDLSNRFARTPTAFSNGNGLTFWQRWIYECLKVHIPSDFTVVIINKKGQQFEEMSLPGRLWRLASFLLPFLGIKQIHALKLSYGLACASLCLICQHLTKLQLRTWEDLTVLRKALTSAIENGNYEFLIEMVKTNADLLHTSLPNDETISRNFLMDAIEFRQEKIARFLIGLPLANVFINLPDNSGKNNILHIAGKLASDSQLSHISGAALQMQTEIQWFKAVESLVNQRQKDAKNNNGETAYQVLAREHKVLLKEAEDWMKGLANSYIIVGALIITIMFAAAFTLPGGNDGGNDENKGFPVFKNKAAFLIYIISDAISLFAAAASLGCLAFDLQMSVRQNRLVKRQQKPQSRMLNKQNY
ncbi:hypothetical protein SLEP1_g56388 [Rubroshorea leprosula]|uniref:PGG domain-containing protein n=1 Tax=Rubroshorea leprosula TaxID=152421 RepID=A0AAV5MKI5_9ROSI|nr:hypothetical protein SLEP1_g56388 [Rubroshorea leprosula]